MNLLTIFPTLWLLNQSIANGFALTFPGGCRASVYYDLCSSRSSTRIRRCTISSTASAPSESSTSQSTLFALINDDDFMEDTESNDDKFMQSLQNRIQNLQDKENKLPLVVLDSMLPRQILKLEIRNKLLLGLIEQRVKVNENPTLGMLGKAILQTGETVTLNKGCEVEINIIDDNNYVEFKAKRRFRLEGEVENTEEGWTEGRVSFLSSKDEEDEEMVKKLGSDNPVSSIANAISRAKEITSPNYSLPNHSNLINRWIELAKENERQPGQIDKLLKDLGPIPNDNEPTEMAFWIGSLINPLPAMGVAREIRPALLMAETAEDRMNIAYDGILRSVKHMDGSARMW